MVAEITTMVGEVIVEVEATMADGIPTVATNGTMADGPNMDGATKIKMTGTLTLQHLAL